MSTHTTMGAPQASGEAEITALIEAAVTALTAAARQTRVRGEGTGQAVAEPVDFAEIAAHVLTTVAANVGSIDTLLAGRPGSWEADYVRRLVEGTAPEEYLLQWRTEPVQLVLDIDGAFLDFGLIDLYDAELADADRACEDEHLADADREQAEALVAAIEALMDADQVAYLAAYTATVRHLLAGRGAQVDVQVTRDDPIAPRLAVVPWWDHLAAELHDIARDRTPLPMTGTVPDWSDGTPADAVRRAGATYTARARQAIEASR